MKIKKIDVINIDCNRDIPQKVISRINKGEKIVLMRMVDDDGKYEFKGELYNLTDEEFDSYCSLTTRFLERSNVFNKFIIGA